MDFPLLSTMTFLPAIGALLIMFMRRQEEAAIKGAQQIALIIVVVATKGEKENEG